jgi:hypothetical protein
MRFDGQTSAAAAVLLMTSLAGCTVPNPLFGLSLGGAADGSADLLLDVTAGGVAGAGAATDDAGAGGAGPGAKDSGPAADAKVFAALPATFAHWRLDESTGKATADEAGRNPGTLSSNAAFVSPGFPQASFANRGAVALDGTGYVALGSAGLPRLEQPITISVWLFVPAETLPLVDRKNVVALSNASLKQSLQLGIQNGYATVWRWAASPIFVSSPTLSAGWHHVAYVSDGTMQSLYLEGLHHDTVATRPPTAPVTAAFLGTYDAANGAERFTGRVDDVRIYDRALTADQISALANGRP